MNVNERLTIVGVVHGQAACIQEARDVIEAARPEIVAIELPPSTSVEDAEGIDARVEAISGRYEDISSAMQSLGIDESVARGIQTLATGFSLQGAEFLSAIKAAKEVGARIEFIDISRDRMFWDLLVETLKHVGRASLRPKTGEFALLPGLVIKPLRIPSLNELSSTFIHAIHEWKRTFENMITVYGETDYDRLKEIAIPFMNQMEGNPVFGDILVEHRSRYMASKLIKLLKNSAGKIVFITGFGHVEGVRLLLEEEFAKDRKTR